MAHARKVRQIAEAWVKTDKKDVERLLVLLIADIAPEVWVPPAHVCGLRGMISYRTRLMKTGTMIRNRLQSLFHRHNPLLSQGALTDQARWEAQKMSAPEKIQICQVLSMSGFGVVITMIVLSAVGDIQRFENTKKLVGYSSLGAGVHDSG